MGQHLYEVALFEADEAGGIRLVGRSTAADLVGTVRARLVAERHAELARLEAITRGRPDLSIVRPETGDDE